MVRPYRHRVFLALTRTVGLAAYEGKQFKAREIIGSALDPAAQLSDTVLTVKQLLAPLDREQVKFVRCLGLNYSEHAVSDHLLYCICYIDVRQRQILPNQRRYCVLATIAYFIP